MKKMKTYLTYETKYDFLSKTQYGSCVTLQTNKFLERVRKEECTLYFKLLLFLLFFHYYYYSENNFKFAGTNFFTLVIGMEFREENCLPRNYSFITPPGT